MVVRIFKLNVLYRNTFTVGYRKISKRSFNLQVHIYVQIIYARRMIRIRKILTGDFTLKRMEARSHARKNVLMTIIAKHMNGQIRMKKKHVNGGATEFASMKGIRKAMTLNLYLVKN